ncbi:hypothetical protein NUU61_007303 [Penicillium alfredii]|uniref:Uncharacterized protein n=1 Tax=Penicillium alfredii TaxID=1506179 RepID=A0A9W9F2G3_9EURO|nr:uncharacterized protein NUU61_007303 [Penicillium alfredii]KAJ5092433.1 hypothetical protein NUU61_007303 [Penicillium alfredii]
MASRKGNEVPTRTKLAPEQTVRRTSKSAHAVSKPKRRPGRPFKMSSQSNSSRSTSGRSTPRREPVSRPRTPPLSLSMLETLPVEVIEQIFLYALNLNLPRASPSLAAALSAEHIYRVLILLAFWDDPPSHPGSKAINRMFAPCEYVPLSLADRRQLQDSVFRCRWCTADRVREQIPTVMILTIHRHWFNAGIVMEPQEKAALDRFIARKDDSVRVFHGKGPPSQRISEFLSAATGPDFTDLAPNANNTGLHQYELHITPMVLIEVRCKELRSITTFPGIDLVSFPSYLLRGPSGGYSDADVAFLEMLRITSCNYTRGRGTVMPSTTTQVNRTLLHQGLHKALLQQKYNAVISLLKIDEYCFRFQAANQNRPVFFGIPSEHFLTVTRVGRDKPHLNAAFFEALLRASAESLPLNSEEITQWTVDNMRRAQQNPSAYNLMNGRFARWLSNFLLRLPDQIDFSHEDPTAQLFYCGQLDLMDMEGISFLDQVLRPSNRDPLVNWLPQSSFRTEDHWVKK